MDGQGGPCAADARLRDDGSEIARFTPGYLIVTDPQAVRSRHSPCTRIPGSTAQDLIGRTCSDRRAGRGPGPIKSVRACSTTRSTPRL